MFILLCDLFYLILSPCLICKVNRSFSKREKKRENFILSQKTLNEEGNRDITRFKCLNLKMKILVVKDLKLQKKIFLAPYTITQVS